MIRVVVVPQTGENFYGMLVKKEKALKTFYRAGTIKSGQRKWRHRRFPGWVNLERTAGGMLVAAVKAMDSEQEWQILEAFIGVLNRHFRKELSSISINYVTKG
jgi:hypothetical protein